jgi:mannose-6-phosphate isomerase
MSAPKHAWVTKSSNEEKPWGNALVWSSNTNFQGKIITIRKGHRTSLKFHKIKNEFFLIMSGLVKVTFGNSRTIEKPGKYPWDERILSPGDVFNVQSECPYRLEALEESIVVEIGDKSSDALVVIEDDYGRANER